MGGPQSSHRPVAVVTGAGSGVGRSIAWALLENGYRVVLAGRRLSALGETVAAAGGFSENALIAGTDVTRSESVNALFAKTLDAFGRVDLLFNNAGVPAPRALFEDITAEDWNAVVAVNLTGAFFVAQAAFRAMKNQIPQGGRIINNGSISAQTPRLNSAPYTATKHAITGLTKSLSLDGRKYNIACGQIDIGNAASPMTTSMASGVPQADGSLKPEPTMAVDDIGKAVLFMASLPLEANVQFMTILATKMPFIGRG